MNVCVFQCYDIIQTFRTIIAAETKRIVVESFILAGCIYYYQSNTTIVFLFQVQNIYIYTGS
jgi:hypothetical protein